MMYIATCFSHFGAMRMKKLCEEQQWPVRMRPVPRALSSSCGVCVQYESDRYCPLPEVPEEVEQIMIVSDEKNGLYESVYRAEGL